MRWGRVWRWMLAVLALIHNTNREYVPLYPI